MKLSFQFSVTKDPRIILQSRRFTLRCVALMCLLNVLGAFLARNRDGRIVLGVSAGILSIMTLICWRRVWAARFS